MKGGAAISSASEKSDDESDSGSASSDSSSSSSLGAGSKVPVSKKPGRGTTASSRKRGSSPAEPEWRQNPELYGIRTSGRNRRQVEKYTSENTGESDSSPQRKKRKRKNSESEEDVGSSSSDESNWGDESPDRKKPAKQAPARRTNNRAGNKRKTGGRSAGRPRKKAQSSEESSEDDRDYQRFSDRRRGNNSDKPSYVVPDTDEDVDSDTVQSWTMEGEDEEGEAEVVITVDKVLDTREGRLGATGPGTTVYSIKQTNKDPNDISLDDSSAEFETQYLIKWKGYSHLHNTWESDASLEKMGAKGLKKIDNFMKKQAEINLWKKQSTADDIEYLECQMEMEQEMMRSYTTVERIVDRQMPEPDAEFPDYYVKWRNLPYVDATWESGRLIEDENQEQIRQFRMREESRFTPSKSHRVLKHRPKFVQEEEQPDFVGSDELRLRDYQLQGLNWLNHAWTRYNSSILADEMGLGKTIQTVSFLYYLFHKYQLYGPFLVVVPLSTLDAWQREFSRWAPDMNVLTYIGDSTSRTIIRSREWIHPGNKRTKFNALLTTYELLLKDKDDLSAISWAVLLVDEAHRLKNEDALLYKTLLAFDANHKVLVTGTPLQNSMKELWALLHFIMPLKFDSWDEFNEVHGSDRAEKKGYAKLHKVLEPFILRRVKKDVEKDLPAKVEQILRVDMSRLQKQYYKFILTKNYDALTKGNKGSTVSFVNVVVELKKCCNHGYLTKPPDETLQDNQTRDSRLQNLLRGSGKLLLLDKLLVRLKETGHRVLIFSQMVRMLDILADYLELRRFPFQRLDGGIKGELRKNAIEHFNAVGSNDFCFLLSTRAGGLGINLATADTVIIFDSDWNPQNDLQAQARAHRIGQKEQVNVYRLVTKNSVEEDIIERAKKKMVLDHLVIQRMDTTGKQLFQRGQAEKSGQPFSKDELNAILKFGAEELFKEEEDKEGDEPICDIDEILKRAETRSEEQMEEDDDGLLSSFKVASLTMDEDEAVSSASTAQTSSTGGGAVQKLWDQIIPASYRQELEQEERDKELAELYLGPRQRKQVLQNDENKENRGNAKRKQADSGDESKTDGESPHKKKKKGEKLKGFNDNEIRRFIKSYKKFAQPLTRMQDIAQDADLMDKQVNELVDLGRHVREVCENAVDGDGNDEASKKSGNVKIGGVAVNAKKLLEVEAMLRPLGKILPDDKTDRLLWTLDHGTKDANFDVDWGTEEDSRLLSGIYEHGLGNWEEVKSDKALELGGKILLNSDCKPQMKHLDARATYLLKVLAKMEAGPAAKKAVKVKPKKKAAAVVEVNGEDGTGKDYISKEIIEDDDSSDSDDKMTDAKKKKKKDDKEKDKKKGLPAPVHFGKAEEELDVEVFKQCKEKMRDVKKYLKALDQPDPDHSEEDQGNHTRQCLLKIGEHIDTILSKMSEDKAREWKSNLWYFVSKFTEFDPKKLYKLYRHAKKKDGGDKDEKDHKDKKKKKHHHHHKDKTDKESAERTSKDASRDRESQQRKSVDGGSKSVPASTTTHQPVPGAAASGGNKTEKPSAFRKDRPSPNNSSSKYNNGDKSGMKHHKFDKGYDKGRGNNNGYNNYQRGGYGGGYGGNRYDSNRPYDSRGQHRGGGANWGRGGAGHYHDRGHNDRYYKNDRYGRSHGGGGGHDSWRHRDSHYDDSRSRGSSERAAGYHEGSEGIKEGYDDAGLDAVIVRDASDV